MTKEMTSPRKIAKAARKIYRKEMQKSAEEMGRTLGNALKPKPKYCPWWLWMWGISFFIKFNKSKK